MRHVVGAAVVALGIVGCTIEGATGAQNRTARSFVHAMRLADSTALVELSAFRSAHNLLCVRRWWPPEYFQRGRGDPPVRLLGTSRGRLRFRATGDPLPGDSARSAYDFFIDPARPEVVQSIMTAYPVGAWSPQLRACIQQGAA